MRVRQRLGNPRVLIVKEKGFAGRPQRTCVLVFPPLSVPHPSSIPSDVFCSTWTGPAWSPAQSISSVLISIQSLMTENPYHNEPGFEQVRPGGSSSGVWNVGFKEIWEVYLRVLGLFLTWLSLCIKLVTLEEKKKSWNACSSLVNFFPCKLQ